MKTESLPVSYPLRRQTPAILLTILALSVHLITWTLYSPWMFKDDFYQGYGFIFRLKFILDWIGWQMVAAMLLFLIYLCVFYKRYTGAICLPIVFGLLMLNNGILSEPRYIWRNLLHGNLTVQSVDFFFWCLVSAVVYLLAIICSAKKRYPRFVYVVIAAVLEMAQCLQYLVRIYNGKYHYFGPSKELAIIFNILDVLSRAIFFAALLLFTAANRKLTPEEHLQFLQTQYNSGKISESNYQKKRAKILRKL